MFRYRLLERQALMLIGYRGSRRRGRAGGANERWPPKVEDRTARRRRRALVLLPARGRQEQVHHNQLNGRQAKALTLHCEISIRPMTALGQKQTPRHHGAMSALPLKADKPQTCWHVRFVPGADICNAAKRCVRLFVTRSPRQRARAMSSARRGRAPSLSSN